MVVSSLVRRYVSGALDHCSFTARRGLAKGMRVRGGLAFLPPFLPPRWRETAETRFIDGLDLVGKVIYDIGALHGHLTLYLARRAKHVVTYEASPANVARIGQNLALNRIANVTVRAVAAGERAGLLELMVDPRRPARATGDPAIGREIAADGEVARVPVVRIDDDVAAAHLPLPDLVKIDVEGMEVAVLRGMEGTLRTRRPDLYIEIHGADEEQKLANARGVVEIVTDAGYRRLLHVESAQSITAVNAAVAREGHLFASAGERG